MALPLLLIALTPSILLDLVNAWTFSQACMDVSVRLHALISMLNACWLAGLEVSVVGTGPLALKLIFSHEVMAKCNCTDAEGRNLLEAGVISGIRCK